MKNFKQIFREGSAYQFSPSQSIIKNMLNINKNRIGKKIMTQDGEEINDSIVLSSNTYAKKEGKKIRIEVLDPKNVVMNVVHLASSEIKMLSKI